ncbi:hypothetical protein [Nostoc sp. C052]|nr:hypothetical protein [Nostoc sp. C052]
MSDIFQCTGNQIFTHTRQTKNLAESARAAADFVREKTLHQLGTASQYT